MIRKVAFVGALALVLGVAACGGSGPNAVPAPPVVGTKCQDATTADGIWSLVGTQLRCVGPARPKAGDSCEGKDSRGISFKGTLSKDAKGVLNCLPN